MSTTCQPTLQSALHGVSVNDEGLVFRRGRILSESFVHPYYGAPYRRPRTYAAFLAKNYWLRRCERVVGSGFWVTDNFSPGSYHHWLIDSLPRLLDAEQHASEDDVVLLPHSVARQRYVRFTLQAFPKIVQRTVEIRPRAKVRVDHLTVLARPGEYRPHALRDVATRVASLADGAGPGAKIYLSRANAARRRVHNEQDVRRLLRESGFQIVEIDPSDPADQVRVCRDAELIVGAHGADLSNLIFMAPGARVLELRRPESPGVFFFDHYRWLARTMGIAYRAMECEVTASAAGLELNNADLAVDLETLRETLDGDGWPVASAPVTVPVGFGARPAFDNHGSSNRTGQSTGPPPRRV
ncbi:MAG: glycosyltransferase family 61 protein [Solirubrobacteraceae bacterium]